MMRRTPQQDRSAVRVERLLDTCGEILTEVGYDELSTTQLAERSGMAIGSVYQFFPDKRAVVDALAQRNLHHYLNRLLPAAQTAPDWWHTIEPTMRIYHALYADQVAFRAVRIGFDEAADRAARATIIDQLMPHLGRHGLPDTTGLRHDLAEAVGVGHELGAGCYYHPDGPAPLDRFGVVLVRRQARRAVEQARAGGA